MPLNQTGACLLSEICPHPHFQYSLNSLSPLRPHTVHRALSASASFRALASETEGQWPKVSFIFRPLKLYWRLQLLTFFVVIRSCRPRPSVKTRRLFGGASVSRIIFSLSFNSKPIWGYFRAMLGLLYSIKISESLKGLSELHMCNILILLHICSKLKRKSLKRLRAQNREQLTFNQWVTGSNPVRLTTDFNNLAWIHAQRAALGETQGKLYLNYIRGLSMQELRVR